MTRPDPTRNRFGIPQSKHCFFLFVTIETAKGTLEGYDLIVSVQAIVAFLSAKVR